MKGECNMNRYNWMSDLSDAAHLKRLVIPGTHDSAAWQTLVGGADKYVITQDWNFRKQMDNGMRFFDLRLSENLNFFHGKYFLKSNMKTFMDDAKAFLKDQPKECLFIQVKRENCDNDKLFDINLKSVIDQNSSLFITQRIPQRMAEVRRKIIFIQRGKYIGDRNVLSYSDNTTFDKRVNSEDFRVQDCYDCGSWTESVGRRVERKEGWIKKRLEESKTMDWWFINFFSHKGLAGSSIRDFSELVASNLRSYQFRNGCQGIMPMDFPEKFEIDRMINANSGK